MIPYERMETLLIEALNYIEFNCHDSIQEFSIEFSLELTLEELHRLGFTYTLFDEAGDLIPARRYGKMATMEELNYDGISLTLEEE